MSSSMIKAPRVGFYIRGKIQYVSVGKVWIYQGSMNVAVTHVNVFQLFVLAHLYFRHQVVQIRFERK